MMCQQYENYFIEHGDGPLSDAMQAHLATCKECRMAREETLWAARIISLKSHEQPDSAFAARSLVRINQAIDDLQVQPKGWAGRLFEAWSQERLPVFRLAVAMVLLAFVGLSIFPTHSLNSLESTSIQPLRLAPAGPPAAFSAAGSRGTAMPVVFSSAPSNFQPNAVDYGSSSPFGFGPSTRVLPVSYDMDGR